MATVPLLEPAKTVPLLSRVLKNFASVLFGQAASQALVFLSLVYLARVLEPEAFGKLGFAQAVLACFVLVSDMGLALLGAKEIAAGKSPRSYGGTVVSLRLCLGLLSFVVLSLAALSLAALREVRVLLILFGLAIPLYCLTLDWLFLGKEKMHGVGAVNITRALIYFLLLLLFVRGADNLLLVPLFFVGGYAASAYLSWTLAERWASSQPIKLVWPSRAWWSLLASSVPLFAYTVLTSSHQNLATVLLGWLRGPGDVAVYLAAYKLIYVFVYLAFLYSLSILSILASSREGRDLAWLSAKRAALGGVLLAVVLSVWAVPIVTLTYGTAYRPAADILRILVWSLPVVSCIAIFSMDLVARGRMQRLLVGLGLGLGVEVGLDMWLIPRYGSLGAALAYMANAVWSLAYLAKGAAQDWESAR